MAENHTLVGVVGSRVEEEVGNGTGTAGIATTKEDEETPESGTTEGVQESLIGECMGEGHTIEGTGGSGAAERAPGMIGRRAGAMIEVSVLPARCEERRGRRSALTASECQRRVRGRQMLLTANPQSCLVTRRVPREASAWRTRCASALLMATAGMDGEERRQCQKTGPEANKRQMIQQNKTIISLQVPHPVPAPLALGKLPRPPRPKQYQYTREREE